MNKIMNYKPKKDYHIIYRYWCDKYPDKSYIGSTNKSLNERAGKVGYNYQYNKETKFNTLIREVGWDNLYVEILAEVESTQAKKIEGEYIKLYNSVNNGYNSREETEQEQRKKEIKQTKNIYITEEDDVLVQMPYGKNCRFDKVIYDKYFKNLYLAPGNGETYNKHGYEISQGGYVSLFKPEHTSVQYTLLNIILEPIFNRKIKPHRYIWRDSNNRNFKLDNMIYKDKSLAEWLAEYMILNNN